MNGSKNIDGALTLERSCFVVIKCSCGAEILLVPDIKAMSEAIETHVVEHQKMFILSDKEVEGIREELIVKTFKVAVKQPVI